MLERGSAGATQTGKNQKKNRKEPEEQRPPTDLIALLPEVSNQLMSDWGAVRKTKHAGPITETVARSLRRQAEKAGMSVAAAVELCVEREWQNLRADWPSVKAHVASGAQSAAPTSRHAGFESKDYRNGVAADGSFT